MTKLKSVINNLDPETDDFDKLEAVKELLFGENEAEYKRQFSQLREQIGQHHHLAKQSISTNSATLNEKLDALEYRFEQSLKAIKQELNQNMERIESINVEANKSRHDLGQALGNIAAMLQK